ncbi:hypothetical protein cyc_01692 [Cyclospora cayetanensis]|uniref:Uncharacterized protein n=1 Tax=Cyclospora cayetanensis TaxID=88456 RepID=A0A1D3CRZ5_9EIME|nr:hypothetical protein cyc_01692 [Cyclospora cayetanensis]
MTRSAVFGNRETTGGCFVLDFLSLQAIIRRVADDHSFQLQCIREGQHTASPSGLQSHTITGIAPGGPSGGSVVSGQVDVSSSTSSAASGTSTVNVLREADVKGSKRQWTSGTQGGISGTAPEDGVLEGLLMLQVSTLFSSPKLVLWKRVDEMLYMVVFEVTENCLLVSNFLTLFIHILADIFGVTADSPPLTNLVLPKEARCLTGDSALFAPRPSLEKKDVLLPYDYLPSFYLAASSLDQSPTSFYWYILEEEHAIVKE